MNFSDLDVRGGQIIVAIIFFWYFTPCLFPATQSKSAANSFIPVKNDVLACAHPHLEPWFCDIRLGTQIDVSTSNDQPMLPPSSSSWQTPSSWPDPSSSCLQKNHCCWSWRYYHCFHPWLADWWLGREAAERHNSSTWANDINIENRFSILTI